MHADRDIVVAHLSVCPSLCHTLVLYRNEYTYHQTLSASGTGMTLVFEVYRCYKISRGAPSAGALNALGLGKNGIFDGNCRLSR